MGLWNRIKVPFWDHKERVAGAEGQQYIFRSRWKEMAASVCFLTLVPLIVSTGFFYQNSKEQAIDELLQETRVFAAGTALDVYMFLQQYIMVLQVVGSMHGVDQLSRPEVLLDVFTNMSTTEDPFIHLDVLDTGGKVLASSCTIDAGCNGGRDIKWITDMQGEHFSMGHIVGQETMMRYFVAVRIVETDGNEFYLRGLLHTSRIRAFLDQMEMEDIVDIYIVDSANTLLTRSKYFGARGSKALVPETNELPAAIMVENPREDKREGGVLCCGAAFIGKTSMKLGLLVSERYLEKFKFRVQRYIVGMFTLSAVFLLLIISTLVTYVVQKLYQVDLRRREYFHQAARSDKLASVGRLAAGVAHEVNNPLAIINEKAGLLQDLFSFSEEYKEDKRLNSTVASIIAAVERAGTITHRLLGFARKVDVSIQELDVEKVILEVISFISKEAEYRGIDIEVDVTKDVPKIISDRGKLQQILLNLANNAIDALDEGGSLKILVRDIQEEDGIILFVKDNGCGISEENQRKVFEPFFSTKTKNGGTGLGLSITYGLVRDLHGSLVMESKVGKGTTFTITLPYEIQPEEK